MEREWRGRGEGGEMEGRGEGGEMEGRGRGEGGEGEGGVGCGLEKVSGEDYKCGSVD